MPPRLPIQDTAGGSPIVELAQAPSISFFRPPQKLQYPSGERPHQVPLDVDVNPIPKTPTMARRGEYFDEMVSNQILCSMAHLHSVKCGSPNAARIIAVARANRFLTFYVYSFMKCFNESLEEDHPDNYYMEREWRVLGNVRFSLEDLSRVILPEEFAKRFRADLPGYYRRVTFI